MSQEIRRLTTRESFFQWADQICLWTTKADFTFGWNCTEFDARKKFERWMRKTLPSTTYLYAVERDPNQDKVLPGGLGINQACHIHAVFDTDWNRLKRGGVLRRDVWKDWKDRYGRCRIEPLESRKAGVDYAMKKVFGYSEAREDPGRVCRRTTVEWNIVFGLGKSGFEAKKRSQSIIMPVFNVECVCEFICGFPGRKTCPQRAR